ncbi:hypothetical protein, partial [Bacillus thuringiensis]|uniref:hypothetical protein n=1 Tax=Bacillus thuringiensis TaxID=1428 RepID=UPI00345A5C89
PRFSCERCGEDMYPQDCWDYVQVIRFSLDEKGPGGFPGFSYLTVRKGVLLQIRRNIGKTTSIKVTFSFYRCL